MKLLSEDRGRRVCPRSLVAAILAEEAYQLSQCAANLSSKDLPSASTHSRRNEISADHRLHSHYILKQRQNTSLLDSIDWDNCHLIAE
jgi:hypothetical protein